MLGGAAAALHPTGTGFEGFCVTNYLELTGNTFFSDDDEQNGEKGISVN